MKNVDLSICLVNHNANHITQNCISSILDKTQKAQVEIIVVDNNSSDKSAVEIRKKSSPIVLIRNEINQGFAKANNQAIKITSGNLIILLNNDTVLKNNALDKMVDFMLNNPRAGIVTCKLFESNRKIVQCNCRTFPLTPFDTLFARTSILSKLFPNNPITKRNLLLTWNDDSKRKVDWVSGAVMMIRRDVLDEIGVLDENFFIYWEDIDLCKRATDAGWEVWYIPEGEIIHYTGQGGGKRSLKTQLYATIHMHRSAYYYFLKHHYKNIFHPMASFTFFGMIALICLKTVYEFVKYFLKNFKKNINLSHAII